MEKIDILLEDRILKCLKPSTTKNIIEHFLEERNIKDYEIVKKKNSKFLLRIDKKDALKATLKDGPIIDGIYQLLNEFQEMKREQLIRDIEDYGGLAIADWEGEYFDDDENY